MFVSFFIRLVQLSFDYRVFTVNGRVRSNDTTIIRPQGTDTDTYESIIDDVTIKKIKMDPWDVVHKVFSADEKEKMTLDDKIALFFHDDRLASLFVHQNYLNVVPKDCQE